MEGAISSRLERKVREDFAQGADVILERLRSLRFPLAEKQSPERLTAAVVLLAKGDPEKFATAAALAQRDWRDVLVAAGLAQGDWEARLDEALR